MKAAGINNLYQRETPVENQSSKLNINDFLRIMVAEIQNMNPMGGSDGGSKTDYISQMVQFTNLEQMNEISEGIGILTLMGQQDYSFSLIGKEVTVNTGKVDDDGKPVTKIGTVERIKFANGYIAVQVDKEYYYLGNVVEVGNEGTHIPDKKPGETEKPPVIEEEGETGDTNTVAQLYAQSLIRNPISIKG